MVDFKRLRKLRYCPRYNAGGVVGQAILSASYFGRMVGSPDPFRLSYNNFYKPSHRMSLILLFPEKTKKTNASFFSAEGLMVRLSVVVINNSCELTDLKKCCTK